MAQMWRLRGVERPLVEMSYEGRVVASQHHFDLGQATLLVLADHWSSPRPWLSLRVGS
jgi:hypothetical protein